MQYRRAHIEGGTFFFTVVTYERQPILAEPHSIDLLRLAFRRVMAAHAFKIDAMVILPDHLHCIWTLPEDDSDYSMRWRLIKSAFSRECSRDHTEAIPIRTSHRTKQERTIWQRRYWEHVIRDDNDMERHVEYIHYNPVKHGLVKAPKDWEYSSFHRYVREGVYDLKWGSSSNMEFGPMVGRE